MSGIDERAKEEQQDSKDNPLISFGTLMPKYEPKQHKVYVDWLVSALTDSKYDNVTNIALAGMYGTGKSSILQGVVEKLKNKPYKMKIVNISLAPLVSKLESSTEDSEPRESPENTHGVEEKSDELQSASDGSSEKAHVARDLQTFELEKEIVKQLIYGVKPRFASYSKFQRVSKSKIWCINIIFSVVCALILSVIGFGTNVFSNIANKILKIQDIDIAGMTSVFVVLALLSFVVLSCLNMTGQIKSISIGKTSVDFTDTDESYFDKYLDEIVNLFESAKIKVVIFEDLDRFHNNEIFDSLRELNRLLNASQVSKKGRRKITFIYAIRDGVFKKQTNQNNEYTPFNRAKFFDLIIPVVPFIGKSNAKHLAKDIFNNVPDEYMRVVDIAAPYIPDARTLKNIANEFAVYKATLMEASNNELGLSEANLLAFLFYKNYYPSDAEKIQYGDSYLDRIYDFSRKVVEENIAEKEEELFSLEQKISNQKTVDGEKEYFEKLNATFKQKLVDIDSEFNGEIRIELSNSTYYIDGSIRDFWDALSEVTEEERVRIARNYSSDRLSFTKKDVLYFVDLPDVKDVFEYSTNELEMSKEKITVLINALKNGALKYLFAHEDIGLKLKGIRRFVGEKKNISLSDFLQATTGEEYGLLAALVSEGLIENDYVLYSSIFPSLGISKNAMNYYIHNVERNVADYRYVLSSKDIHDILKEDKELGRAFNPSLLNINLFDCCIDDAKWNEDSQPKNQSAEIISTIFDSISTNNQVFSFMSVYLSQGDIPHIANFVLPRLSRIYSRIFLLVLSNMNRVPDLLLEDQLNTVLSTVNDDVEYEMPSGNELHRFKNLILGLPIIAGTSDMKSSHKVAEILPKVIKSINNLGEINWHLWLPIVESQSFVLNRKNISIAYVVLQYREDSNEQWKNRDFEHFPSLNEIRAVDNKFFNFVLERIEEYIWIARLSEKSNNHDALITGDSDNEVAEILNTIYVFLRNRIVRQSSNENKAKAEITDKEMTVVKKDISDLLEKSSVKILRLDDITLESRAILQSLFETNTLECSIENLAIIKERYISEYDDDSGLVNAMYSWINEQRKLKWGSQTEDRESDAEYSTAVLYLLNMPIGSVKVQKKMELLRTLDSVKTIKETDIEESLSLECLDLQNSPNSFAELMSLGFIDDSLASYKFIHECDWEVKKAYLLRSKNAEQYIPTSEFSAEEIQNILLNAEFESTKLSREIVKQFDLLYGKFEHDKLFTLIMRYIEKNIDNPQIDQYQLITTRVLEAIASESGIERLDKLANLGVNKATIQKSLKPVFEQRSIYTLQEQIDFLKKIESSYADAFNFDGKKFFEFEDNLITQEFISCMDTYSEKLVGRDDFLYEADTRKNTKEGRIKIARRIATWNRLHKKLAEQSN